MISFQTYASFRNTKLACPKCDWRGAGRETQVGKVATESKVCEYFCPKCKESLAVAPFPRMVDDQR